jgi:hypothetical protein
MSQFAAADFVKDSKLSLDLRNYYFNQDTDGGAEGGQWGQAFMLNYKSGFTEGAVGVGVDLFGGAGYRLADHGDQFAGRLFTGDNDRLNKAGATLKARVAGTTAYAGALRPTVPVYVNNDARLLPQMVEGVLVTNQDIAGLTLAAGHMTRFMARDVEQWTKLGSNEFSLLGADYKVMDGLTAQYYYGQVNNDYQQHFVGLKYSAEVGGGKLGADVRFFNTKDEEKGSATKGDANNLWSVLVNYSVAGHTLGLGHQKTSDEYEFRNVGSSKYIISERMIGPGAMHNPDEAVTLISYGFDFGTVGVKGLNASIIHQMGDSGKGRVTNGVLGPVVDHTETDIVVGYTIPEGQFKGLGARLMHGMYDGDDKVADVNQTRFIVNYSIPLM